MVFENLCGDHDLFMIKFCKFINNGLPHGKCGHFSYFDIKLLIWLISSTIDAMKINCQREK